MEAPTPKPPHPLAVKVAESAGAALCAALWALRHQLQDMTLVISGEELEKFQKSLDYHSQAPILQLVPSHRGLAISMIDKDQRVAITQSESTEEDQRRKEAAQSRRALVEQIPNLVNEHRAMRATGADSDSMVDEIHAAAMAAYEACRV